MDTTERVVRHFQSELEQLKTRILEMGGLAEEEVRIAIKGLVERDSALIDRVLAGDEPVNALHIEIDSRCFTLLALYQPMAADLRAIVAAVKINTDLERVGDLAVNIAEAAQRYIERLDVQPPYESDADGVQVEPLRVPQTPTLYTEDDLHVRQFMADTSHRLVRKGAFKAA